MNYYIAKFIGPFPYGVIEIQSYGDSIEEAKKNAQGLLEDLVKTPQEWELDGIYDAYTDYLLDDED